MPGYCRQRLLGKRGVMACVVQSVCVLCGHIMNTGEHSQKVPLTHNLLDFKFIFGSFHTLRNPCMSPVIFSAPTFAL